MTVLVVLALFFLCNIFQNSALLFHGDNIPGQTTTLGPLGKDAYLSFMIQELMDLKAQVKRQEQEIQTLRTEQAFKNNVTASIMDKLAAFRAEWNTANKTLMQGLANLHNKILSMAQLQIVNNSNHVGVIQKSFVRLVDGDEMNSGRVEVYYHGEWATVCDDGFDVYAARVVCRMLGLPSDHPIPYGESYFGLGNATILFGVLNCNGNELDLIHCGHRLSATNCAHNEDAGVRCR